MATSKKSSTSKTARVMNLLSKNREETAEAETLVTETPETIAPAPAASEAAAPVAAAAEPAAPTPIASHPTTPPLISAMQADSAISDQVLSALESALDNELNSAEEPNEAPASIPEAAPEIEPETAPEPEVEATPEIATEPQPAADPVDEAVVEAITQITEAEEAVVEAAEASLIQTPAEETSDTDAITPPARVSVDKSTIYVNVMESLVEDKATKYINMFGLCKCPRCVADVKALALNRLEPKYVVMQAGDVIPRITLYEGQFSAAVTAQLLTACRMVMEHPRHGR